MSKYFLYDKDEVEVDLEDALRDLGYEKTPTRQPVAEPKYASDYKQMQADLIEKYRAEIVALKKGLEIANSVVQPQEQELNRLRVELLHAAETNKKLQESADGWRAIVDEAQKERIDAVKQMRHYSEVADGLRKKLYALEELLNAPNPVENKHDD